MSTIIILAPIIIGSWPTIAPAVIGAAAALGFVVRKTANELKEEEHTQIETVELELEKSSVAAQNLAGMNEMVLEKDNVQLRVRTDEMNRCVICATGGKSKGELAEIAEEFKGKLNQVFVYNKVMTELKNKGFNVTNQEVLSDQSIKINVRHIE
ncbi:MAG: hypothetical protein A2Y07_11805 [Planctomycetes bacterium GWF2_50_10]|nr:MAG: hypothetical protein A2Y07_11805 [Planctomycetes bacterium GWF2_50_10]